MQKYRKKPVVIEALQYHGQKSLSLLVPWIGESATFSEGKLQILTLEGPMTVSKGDFVIKGVNGEFYPCKPDIFNKTYDLVKETK